MLREWIRTFAEFPGASLLFAVFILISIIFTGFWMESFLGSIANIIDSIKAVHVVHEKEEEEEKC